LFEKKGGICLQTGVYSAICQCQNGFNGDRCEIPSFDICALKNCQNGGVCVNTTQFTAICICPQGYQGDTCEIPPFDICQAMMCQNSIKQVISFFCNKSNNLIY
jgi:hypothetical protein